ncbi:MAG: hypothetical protein ACXVLX_10185 [Ilumatobacteraceae bacterium]
MRSLSDQEFAETESLLRQRLAQLAEHAPTAVWMPDEVPVVAIKQRGRNRRQLGAIAAVTALLGAGGFTIYSFLAAGNDGGAATPEEAVTTFVSAIEHSDVLGMIDVTLPEEVGVLRAAVDSTTSDAKRLGLLGNDFDTTGVKGLDVSFNDLRLDTNYLEGGLASVTATSGTFHASFDPNAFPFGSKLRALLDQGQHASSHSSSLGTTNTPALLMTVQRAGRWYVSVEYTIAEYIRRSAGWEMPAPVTRSPVGFDSPEAAANAFYDRLAALNLPGVLEIFAPGEDAMAWLAQSWIDNAQEAIQHGRADGWAVAVSALTYETIGSGSHRTLNPVTFKLQGTVPATFAQASSTSSGPAVSTGDPMPPTGAPQPFTIERADGCTTYLGDGVKNVFGLGDSPLFKPVDGGFQLCGTGPVGAVSLLLISTGVAELPAVSVVESGGKWYVSPLGTALASVSTSLHDVDSGSSLFDSPLAPFLYGGLGRGYLESWVVGHSADSIDPTCLPALTVANGTVTGVVADPSPQAVRACASTVNNTVVSSGGAVEGPPSPVIQEATATSISPVQAPPATTP